MESWSSPWMFLLVMWLSGLSFHLVVHLVVFVFKNPAAYWRRV